MQDTDRIEKIVELDAPVSRVWRALTDHQEFGQWFRVALDQPFETGIVSTGKMTYPGFEGWPWLATVEQMDHEKRFAFRWHDYDEKSGVALADQPTTLVEFCLEPTPRGTRLRITESGFDALADHRRIAAMRSNAQGWAIQSENIRRHVEG